MNGNLRRRVGRNIAELREKRGWVQKELAPRLEISRSRLSKWESGDHMPSLEALVKMAEVLEVSLDELVRCGAVSEDSGLAPAQRGLVEKAIRNLSQLLGRSGASGRN